MSCRIIAERAYWTDLNSCNSSLRRCSSTTIKNTHATANMTATTATTNRNIFNMCHGSAITSYVSCPRKLWSNEDPPHSYQQRYTDKKTHMLADTFSRAGMAGETSGKRSLRRDKPLSNEHTLSNMHHRCELTSGARLRRELFFFLHRRSESSDGPDCHV